MIDFIQKEQRSIRSIAWDGVELRVSPAPGIGLIQLELDGANFARMAADATEVRALRFAFAPGGSQRMNLVFAFDDGARTAPVGVRLGKPGIAAAMPIQALRPLTDQALIEVLHEVATPQPAVAIVVPVYNAPDLVRACLDSVLEHTTGRAQLIIIDDASTDAAVAPLLMRYAGLPGVRVFNNPSNLGFTATVNRGMALAGSDDVVLLNADAEVAAHWLEGLRRAAYAGAATASATAVSDNAGAFSVPELEQQNPLPAIWTFEQTARALWQQAGTAYPRLPTGNGFCMYLRRAAIEAVGDFDADAFAEGYGEENDWSQRAEAAGWHHVIAGNVLVRHARSMSFGHERRARLGARGMQILRERWPNYEANVGADLFSFERCVLDWRVRRVYAEAVLPGPLPRLLCVGAALGEAAIAAKLPFELWCLHDDAGTLRLQQRVDSTWLERERAEPESASPEHSLTAIPPLARWLQIHAFEMLVDTTQADGASDRAQVAHALGLASALVEARVDLSTTLDRAVRKTRSFSMRAQ